MRMLSWDHATMMPAGGAEARAKGEALALDPYDALLDEYEPGGRAIEVDRLFGELETFLPDFLGRAIEIQAGNGAPRAPKGPFPVEQQRALQGRILELMGF